MKESSGYVHLFAGVICFLMAWYSHVPAELHILPFLSSFAGLISLLAAFVMIRQSRSN